MAENEDKDFMDFDLDDPLESVEPLAAPARSQKQDDTPASPGVLIYEGKKYAVGLSWLVGDDEGDNKLALKRAKGFGADFYCLRQGIASQHGFGYLSMGHRINMPVLASVVADVFVGEWHGIFAADNGWWYVAVHADNIAPKGDRFFTSEEEAYNFFVAENKSHRWPRTYAPAGWNLNDSANEIPLNKIIGEAVAPTLKPVTTDAIFSGRRNRNLALTGVVVLILLLVAGVLGQQFLPSLIPSRAQLPIPNLELSDNLQAPPEEPVLIAEREADNLSMIPLPPATDFVADCIEAMSDLSKPMPGWTLTSLHCSNLSADGHWLRQTGSIQMLAAYLDAFPRGAQTRFDDTNTMVVQISMPKATGIPASRPLSDENHVKMLIGSRFSDLGNFTIENVVPVTSQQLLDGVAAIEQAQGSNTLQTMPDIKPLTYNDLPYIAVKIETRTPPNLLVKYFSIPGMVLEDITGTLNGGSWTYKGKIILAPGKNLIAANLKAKALLRTQ